MVKLRNSAADWHSFQPPRENIYTDVDTEQRRDTETFRRGPFPLLWKVLPGASSCTLRWALWLKFPHCSLFSEHLQPSLRRSSDMGKKKKIQQRQFKNKAEAAWVPESPWVINSLFRSCILRAAVINTPLSESEVCGAAHSQRGFYEQNMFSHVWWKDGLFCFPDKHLRLMQLWKNRFWSALIELDRNEDSLLPGK